jgi:putative addiction module killer protein
VKAIFCYDGVTIDFCELEITMTAVTPFVVKKRQDFKDWLNSLTDDVGKAAIVERIERLKKGNYGDVKPITDAPGLYEMRIKHGPGYRVYFILTGKTIILLLCGGNKSTQTADIKYARNMMEDIKAQAAAGKEKREKEERKTAKADKSKQSMRK